VIGARPHNCCTYEELYYGADVWRCQGGGSMGNIGPAQFKRRDGWRGVIDLILRRKPVKVLAPAASEPR
jgi:hypothetical protein